LEDGDGDGGMLSEVVGIDEELRSKAKDGHSEAHGMYYYEDKRGLRDMVYC